MVKQHQNDSTQSTPILNLPPSSAGEGTSACFVPSYTKPYTKQLTLFWLAALLIVGCNSSSAPTDREEVVFWHFWGGKDRPVVMDIVERFNASQDRYWVRAIAMPGNNLDLKFFLSVVGGDPPDLVNQDDPILADWAYREALTPIAKLATEAEYRELQSWLFPAANNLASYGGQLYALPNGLDIRALYYNKTMLDEHGLDAPRTLAELDEMAETIAPANSTTAMQQVGYLPDPRRLWAWGAVFGGQFCDFTAENPRDVVTANHPRVLAALEWMAAYSKRYGASRLAAFRSGDQALTGMSFPLLADRRYAAIMDGQWRVRDIEQAAQANNGKDSDEFGVVPLPPPAEGLEQAGWVNGNFFIVPRGANNPSGAWEFMKFWSGFGGHEAEAARACDAGGWIPVSQEVVDQPDFQEMLQKQPMMRTFVELAGSSNQLATPALPVSSFYYREIVSAAQDVMYRGIDPKTRLALASERVRSRLSDALRIGQPKEGDHAAH